MLSEINTKQTGSMQERLHIPDVFMARSLWWPLVAWDGLGGSASSAESTVCQEPCILSRQQSIVDVGSKAKVSEIKNKIKYLLKMSGKDLHSRTTQEYLLIPDVIRHNMTVKKGRRLKEVIFFRY